MASNISLSGKQSIFRDFAEDLKDEEDYNNRGAYYCDQVYRFLSMQNTPRFYVVSTVLGTAIRGKTWQSEPDFDIIIKVNNGSMPLRDILKYWERTLQINARKLYVHSILRTGHSLRFKFVAEPGISMSVELLPYSSEANKTPADVIWSARRNPGTRRLYSTSLVESPQSLIRLETSSLIQDICRLAQFWLKSMDLEGKKLRDGSQIFESLAVAAAIEQRRNSSGPTNFFLTFRRLVENVDNINQMKIAFAKSRAGNFDLVEVPGLVAPYIMEYGKRCDNLLRRVNPDVLPILRRNANVMLIRVNVWLWGSSVRPDILFVSKTVM